VTQTAQPSLSGTPPQIFGKPFNPSFPDSSIGHRRPML
jgi:hypothetical protein